MCGKREAIVFIHQVGAGEKQELHLCSQCAYEHGLQHLEGDVGKALAELLQHLPLNTKSDSESPEDRGQKPILKQKKKYSDLCPNCGLSVQELKKNAQAGCEMCWHSYGELLLGAAGKQRRAIPYRGRFSVKVSRDIAKKQELERLKQLLQTAVTMEDYEQAAVYRDQIRLIEQGEAGCD